MTLCARLLARPAAGNHDPTRVTSMLNKLRLSLRGYLSALLGEAGVSEDDSGDIARLRELHFKRECTQCVPLQ